MCNKVTSDQQLAKTSAEEVVIFQVSLELVREEDGIQLYNKNDNVQHSMDQIVYMNWDIENKNNAVT